MQVFLIGLERVAAGPRDVPLAEHPAHQLRDRRARGESAVCVDAAGNGAVAVAEQLLSIVLAQAPQSGRHRLAAESRGVFRELPEVARTESAEMEEAERRTVNQPAAVPLLQRALPEIPVSHV